MNKWNILTRCLRANNDNMACDGFNEWASDTDEYRTIRTVRIKVDWVVSLTVDHGAGYALRQLRGIA